jgi:hypothetical protein
MKAVDIIIQSLASKNMLYQLKGIISEQTLFLFGFAFKKLFEIAV